MTLKVFSIRHLPTGKWHVVEKQKDEITASDIRDIRYPYVSFEADAIKRISTLERPEDWEIVERPDFDLNSLIEYTCAHTIRRGIVMERLGINTLHDWLLVQGAFHISFTSTDDASPESLVQEFAEIVAKDAGFDPNLTAEVRKKMGGWVGYISKNGESIAAHCEPTPALLGKALFDANVFYGLVTLIEWDKPSREVIAEMRRLSLDSKE